MQCIKCQSELRENASFCIQCGQRIPRCPGCGSVLTKRTRYCIKDGTKIPEEILELLPEETVTVSSEPVNAWEEQSVRTKTAGAGRGKKTPVIVALVLIFLLGLGAGGVYAVSGGRMESGWIREIFRQEAKGDREQETAAAETEAEEIPETAAPTEAVTEATEATEAAAATTAPLAATEPDVYAHMPEVGDMVWFGAYEQDNTPGADAIEWIVLAKNENRILVTSRFLLDSRPFHFSSEEVSWETSSVRQWLNETFYNTAFTAEEKGQILRVQLTETDVTDQVYLLSVEEVESYFPGQADRFCQATPYAIGRDLYVNASTGGSWWLLRTSGTDSRHVMSVDSDGSIDYEGGKVESKRGAVRPAMWIEWK